MTVAELIEQLKTLDQDKSVIVAGDVEDIDNLWSGVDSAVEYYDYVLLYFED